MLDKTKFKIHSIEGAKMVHSFEFYKATGLKRCNYTRWTMECVLNCGVPGRDYIPAPENVTGRTVRFRLRYYLEIDFAIALSIFIKRKEALQVRDHLLEAKGIKVEPDKSLIPDLKASNIPLRNFNKPKE